MSSPHIMAAGKTAGTDVNHVTITLGVGCFAPSTAAVTGCGIRDVNETLV